MTPPPPQDAVDRRLFRLLRKLESTCSQLRLLLEEVNSADVQTSHNNSNSSNNSNSNNSSSNRRRSTVFQSWTFKWPLLHRLTPVKTKLLLLIQEFTEFSRQLLQQRRHLIRLDSPKMKSSSSIQNMSKRDHLLMANKKDGHQSLVFCYQLHIQLLWEWRRYLNWLQDPRETDLCLSLTRVCHELQMSSYRMSHAPHWHFLLDLPLSIDGGGVEKGSEGAIAQTASHVTTNNNHNNNDNKNLLRTPVDARYDQIPLRVNMQLCSRIQARLDRWNQLGEYANQHKHGLLFELGGGIAAGVVTATYPWVSQSRQMHKSPHPVISLSTNIHDAFRARSKSDPRLYGQLKMELVGGGMAKVSTSSQLKTLAEQPLIEGTQTADGTTSTSTQPAPPTLGFHASTELNTIIPSDSITPQQHQSTKDRKSSISTHPNARQATLPTSIANAGLFLQAIQTPSAAKNILGVQDNDLILLNDPNCDGMMVLVGDGFMVGGVVDGSGAGIHPRMAANLTLATLYDHCRRWKSVKRPDGSVEWVQGEEEEECCSEDTAAGRSSAQPPATSPPYLHPSQWRTSHDALRFLEEVVLDAHRTLVEVDECGATTLILFTMAPLRGAMPDLNSDPLIGNVPFRHVSSDALDDAAPPRIVMNYVIAGDTDGFFLDSRAKGQVWRSLHPPPLFHEKLRINTSLTPGGIGKHHGSLDQLWGAFLFPQFVRRPEQPLNEDWEHFYKYDNNIHFGQVVLEPEEKLIFASDGLGDTLNPIQLYPRPSMIPGLEKFKSWEQFSEFEHSMAVIDHMKEFLLNRILRTYVDPDHEIGGGSSAGGGGAVDDGDSLKSPMEESSHGSFAKSTPALNSGYTRTVPSNFASPLRTGMQLTVSDVVKACVQHAWQTTRNNRRLYENDDFFYADRTKKTEKMHAAVEDWIKRRWPRTVHQGLEWIEHFGLRYALPRISVPFAKVDHLGMLVVKPPIAAAATSPPSKHASASLLASRGSRRQSL